MLDNLIDERRKKVERLESVQEHGAYPARTKRTHTIGAFLEDFTESKEQELKAILTGRLISQRGQGGLTFLTLRDESGEVQLVLNQDRAKNYDEITKLIDLGDFLEARGVPHTTKRGTESLLCDEVRVISKALRPYPSEYYGIEDKEILLRQRYLDLLTHPETKDLFYAKARFWGAMRTMLQEEGFLEVETPIVETMPGGAEAEPFTSHHNALDTEVYLRIAPELWLKKLMVAGYEKVFEIGRVFRNEGMSNEHLQDFTNLEFYWAYKDYQELMDFVEAMVKKTVEATTGETVTRFGDHELNWGADWTRYEYNDLFKEENGIDLENTNKEELLAKARELNLEKITDDLGKGRLIDLIYKKTVRPKLIQPCFLINPPVEIEPLAKRMEHDPSRVERFQILAGGTELAKGFSELNNPIDQRERFEEQAKLRKEGDAEAMRLDEDYLEAMEYGMPPNAGFGMGDRLFATFVNRPIRETVLFPLVKPKE